MDSSKLKALFVSVLALFAALYLGIAAATAQVETVLWVVGTIGLVICLALGRKIWLLIPFLGAVNLRVPIPGAPNTLLVAQALVVGFCTLLFLIRRLPYRIQWTELEFWVLVLSLNILQAYIRNPFGINLFGGDTVGGKGYVLYAVALVSALLLSNLRVSPKDLKWILPLSILGGLVNFAVAILGYFSPTFAYYTGAGNMPSASEGFDDRVIDDKSATRVGSFVTLSGNLSLWISSYISPLKACLRPMWALLVLMAIVSAAMSGFRNGIVIVGLTFFVGIAYRNGFVGIILSLFGGIGGLALLAVTNSILPLPPNIQRSLTFLPGTWEERYKDDAKGSSEWRFEIWKEVLTSERWIKNKWMGDGLGFTAIELAAQQNVRKDSRMGISGFDAHRETILSNGDYHSGPISTIRVIGYIGLFFFLLAQYRLAVHAHRQILRCRGTEWYPLALFLGIPMITTPLIFVFLFGDFKAGASGFLLSLAMCRLLENNLPLPAYVLPTRYAPAFTKRQPAQARGDRAAVGQ